jgi:hypothetical protein
MSIFPNEEPHMIKIVFLPLDERPCNIDYPKAIFASADIELVLPDKNSLGNKKQPASFQSLRNFLLKETHNAYGLVVSIDMLLYGGIVPSRLHNLDRHELKQRLALLEAIRENNPNLKIFAFDLIMRNPQYDSNDEEPDYYEMYGRRIFRLGYLEHRRDLGLLTPEEETELDAIQIPSYALNDYLDRRKTNLELNQMTLKLVENQTIDFAIFPQDDAARYGYTARDQSILRTTIDTMTRFDHVLMYPGADEVGNVLLSRLYLTHAKIKPKIYSYYPSESAKTTIPLLEDRYLDTTVKYQILAAGGRTATSIAEADIVLFVNASATRMASNANINADRDEGMTTLRNMHDFLAMIEDVIIHEKKPAMIADVATLNGSDHELMKGLDQRGLLDRLSAYAGWNTSSNTLGTTIPHGIQTYLHGFTRHHFDFLMSRYVEDYGYMGFVRSKVIGELKSLGKNYFDVSGKEDEVARLIQDGLKRFVDTYLPSLHNRIEIESVTLPWKRMFEIGLSVKTKA